MALLRGCSYPDFMTDHATEVLDRYLDPATPSHGALMLSGAWGSGKTHFVKDYFKRRDVLRRKNEPLNGPAHLYATLNGVASTDEVAEQFWASANPLLSSKVAQALGAAAVSGVQIASRGQALRGDNAKMVRNFLSRPIVGYPLVFDDLERSQLPLPQIMGFISDFVEQHKAKVIILANEAEIERDPDVWNDYRRQKEKLVSKTIEVSPDIGLIFRGLVEALPNVLAKAAALKNEELAIAAFQASGHRNLRSLRAALDDFDLLLTTSGELLAESEALLKQALPYVIATGMELRAGTLQPNDIAEVGMASLMSMMRSEAKSEARDLLASIAAKYESIDFMAPVVPPSMVSRLYSSGVVERDALNTHLKEHPLYLGDETPSWKRMWRWFEMPMSTYQNVRASFLADLQERRIVSVGPILHSAGIVLGLRKSEDDLLDGADIEAWFRRYLDQLVDEDGLITGSYDPAWGLDTSFDGLGYQEKDDPTFLSIKDIIIDAIRRARERHLIKYVPELLESLNSGNTARLYEQGFGDPSIGSLPALHLIAVDDFKSVALQDGVINRELMASLRERYNRGYRPQLIEAEKDWVDRLLKELEQEVMNLPSPHRKRVLGEVEYYRKRLKEVLSRPTPEEP